ncbi:MAG TPA: DUF3108 domain-containing protein [Opitutaceae bacterium]|nr:DUF3108 domain-containing protein [Opitutaceae bacterium]
MNVRPLLLLALLSVAGLRAAATELALRPGETFVYRVGWGIFSGAGEVRISAQNETLEGLPQLRLTTTTATHGFIRMLYPFKAEAESVFDARDGRLLAAKASSTAGSRGTRASIVFNYAQGTASYVDYIHAERDKPALPIPPGGRPADLITSLVQARTYAMKPGDKRPMLVLFDDEFYSVTIFADRYEKILTPLGGFDTLVLVPRMEKDPKGIFKRGGEIRVWITQDERHLPVKMEVKLKFGTATAQLTDYTPPSAAVAQNLPSQPHS